MPIHFHDLSLLEIDMLRRMHGGSASEEPIGLGLHEFEDWDALTAHLLIAKRLAIVRNGWHGSFWLLLTQAGARIYRESLDGRGRSNPGS